MAVRISNTMVLADGGGGSAKKTTWSSYQEAANAGYSNIMTQSEWARRKASSGYSTYPDYLQAMYNKYVGNKTSTPSASSGTSTPTQTTVGGITVNKEIRDPNYNSWNSAGTGTVTPSTGTVSTPTPVTPSAVGGTQKPTTLTSTGSNSVKIDTSYAANGMIAGAAMSGAYDSGGNKAVTDEGVVTNPSTATPMPTIDTSYGSNTISRVDATGNTTPVVTPTSTTTKTNIPTSGGSTTPSANNTPAADAGTASEPIDTYEEYLRKNDATYKSIYDEQTKYYDEQNQQTLAAIEEQRNAVYAQAESKREETIAHAQAQYSELIAAINAQKASGEALAQEQRDLLLSMSETQRNTIYAAAEAQREADIAYAEQQHATLIEYITAQKESGEAIAEEQKQLLLSMSEQERAAVLAAAQQRYESDILYATQQYDTVIAAINQQKETGMALAEEQRDLLLSMSEEMRNKIYEAAEIQRKNAYTSADVERERGVVDARSSYEQSKATYGANAEAMAGMGLTGSGYSDYINSQAYAQQRAETQRANAQAAAVKRDADYTESQAKLDADTDYLQNKYNADAQYSQTVHELDLSYQSNKLDADKALADSKYTAESNKNQTEADAESAHRQNVYNAESQYNQSMYEIDTTYQGNKLTADQALEEGKHTAESAEREAKAKDKSDNELSASYYSLYDMAKSGSYTADEIRDLAKRAGLNETDIAALARIANDYETSIKYGDPEAGESIQKEYDSGKMSDSEYQAYRQQWNSEIDTSADAFLGEDGTTIMNKSAAKAQLDNIINNPLCDDSTKRALQAVYNSLYTPITKSVTNKSGSLSELEEKGNNFRVQGSSGKYDIESGGKVEDKNIQEVASGLSDDTVFGYQNKIYIKKGGNVCLINPKPSSSKDYEKLHNIFFGSGDSSSASSATESGKTAANTPSTSTNSSTTNTPPVTVDPFDLLKPPSQVAEEKGQTITVPSIRKGATVSSKSTGENFSRSGNNYEITYNGQTYKVQSGGSTGDRNVKAAAESVSDGEIFGFNNKLYLKKGGSVYIVEARPLSKSGYKNLYDAYFG